MSSASQFMYKLYVNMKICVYIYKIQPNYNDRFRSNTLWRTGQGLQPLDHYELRSVYMFLPLVHKDWYSCSHHTLTLPLTCHPLCRNTDRIPISGCEGRYKGTLEHHFTVSPQLKYGKYLRLNHTRALVHSSKADVFSQRTTGKGKPK